MVRSAHYDAARAATGCEMADEETFKVTDRRGRPREEVEGPPPSESRQPGSGGAGVEAGASTAAEAGPPDLQAIFLMLASSALISLGDAPDPVTGERHGDLGQAQEAIDMLLVLRDKTSGNRTLQEDQLLEQLIYDLQMRFVRAAEARR
jgi:hypothetical protein